MKKQFAVMGLGGFGESVARELMRLGHEVKAITPTHHKIAEKLGADRIFHPEYEMGLRVAQTMAHPNMLDYIALGDNCFVIEVRPGEVLEDRPFSDLKIDPEKVRLLAIKHGNSAGLPAAP